MILRENSAADVTLGAKLLEVDGLAKPTAARVMSLARGGQTLITSDARDDTRQNRAQGRVARPLDGQGRCRSDRDLRSRAACRALRRSRRHRESVPCRACRGVVDAGERHPQQSAAPVDVVHRPRSRTRRSQGAAVQGSPADLARNGRPGQDSPSNCRSPPNQSTCFRMAPGSSTFRRCARRLWSLPRRCRSSASRRIRGARRCSRFAPICGAQRALLILDNCEHLVKPAAELALAVLRAAPHVRIIASSREALHVPGEQSFPLRPLPLPGRDANVTQLAASPAVQLFSIAHVRTSQRSHSTPHRHRPLRNW